MRRLIMLLSLLTVLFMVSSVAFAQTSGETTYTVVPGDTLFRIATKFGVTTQAVAQRNNLTNLNLIFSGQKLIIPAGGTTPTATPVPATAAPTTVAPTAVPGTSATYTVVPGDTLFRIALKFKTTTAALVAANKLANANIIYVGQKLVIPAGGVVPTAVPTGAPAPTAVPTTAPSGGTYTVKSGDTLFRIAQKFGVTTAAIISANNLKNPNLLYVGQVLQIPGSGGVVPTAAPGTTPVPTAGPVVTSGFELGGQVFSFAYPAQMRGAGMTWAKSQVVWDGSASPNIAKGAIDAARSNGFKILLSVIGDKNQLNANPTQYYQNFANFLAGVAALNPDGIEVWNEENIDREWPNGKINGANYAQMLSAAYQAIKKANGNVLVISGAPSPTGYFGGKCTSQGCDDNIFLTQMAQAGAANSMDCVGVHYNEGIISPTRTSGDPRGNSTHYTRYYQTMVNVYASAFPNKPLCFTELGFLSPEGYAALPAGFEWAANVKAQDQAIWLAEAASLAKASRRVRLMIVWNVDSTLYGADPQAGYAIIRPNNTCNACVTLGAVMAAK